jgi:peptide deformylase
MGYDIVTFGNRALREKAQPVEDVNDDIRQLAADMIESMRTKDGIGLAAEQIGRNEHICVIDVPEKYTCGNDMPLVLINLKIEEGTGELYEQEGCLSFPDIYVKVKRMKEVKASYTDLDGKRQTVQAEGLLSRAIQHELDHLNGVLLVDHMTPVQKVANAGKLKRLRRAAKRAGLSA